MFHNKKWDIVSKYFDPKIFDLILSNKLANRLGGEKVYLSLLWLTVHAEKSEYDISVFVNGFAHAVDIMLDSGATIEGFYGNSICCYYNHPTKDQEHARRAIELSISLYDTLFKMCENIRPCIGINTGFALAGNFGSPRLFQYKVIGDNVELVHYMAASIKDSKILVSESTIRETGEKFSFGTKREINFNGKDIICYELKREAKGDGGSSGESG